MSASTRLPTPVVRLSWRLETAVSWLSIALESTPKPDIAAVTEVSAVSIFAMAVAALPAPPVPVQFVAPATVSAVPPLPAVTAPATVPNTVDASSLVCAEVTVILPLALPSALIDVEPLSIWFTPLNVAEATMFE